MIEWLLALTLIAGVVLAHTLGDNFIAALAVCVLLFVIYVLVRRRDERDAEAVEQARRERESGK